MIDAADGLPTFSNPPAVAAPIGAIDQLTVVSTDGAGALPKQVNDNVVQTLSMLKTSTGIDLEALLKQALAKSTNGEVPAEPAKPAPRAVAGKAEPTAG